MLELEEFYLEFYRFDNSRLCPVFILFWLDRPISNTRCYSLVEIKVAAFNMLFANDVWEKKFFIRKQTKIYMQSAPFHLGPLPVISHYTGFGIYEMDFRILWFKTNHCNGAFKKQGDSIDVHHAFHFLHGLYT